MLGLYYYYYYYYYNYYYHLKTQRLPHQKGSSTLAASSGVPGRVSRREEGETEKEGQRGIRGWGRR